MLAVIAILGPHPLLAYEQDVRLAYVPFTQHYDSEMPGPAHRTSADVSQNPKVQQLQTSADREAIKGRYSEAAELYQQALRELGEGREPAVAGTLEYNLGYVLRLWGDYHAAIPHLRAALQYHRKVYERHSLPLTFDRLGLGVALNDDEKFLEAESLIATGLGDWSKTFGGRDPMNLRLSRLLANLELENGKAPQALARMRKIVPLIDSEFGATRFETPRAYFLLGLILNALGKQSDAIVAGQKAIDLWQGNPQAPRHELADVIMMTGLISIDLQDSAGAERALQTAVSLYEGVTPRDPVLTQTLEELARAQLLQGKYPEAQANYEKALEARREDPVQPADDVLLGNAHYGLASSYFAQGHYGQAAPHYEKSWHIRRAVRGDHPDTAGAGDELGRTLLKLHRAHDARQVLGEVLDMRERLPRMERDAMVRTLHYLGLAASMDNDPKAADRYYREALNLAAELGLQSSEAGFLAYDFATALIVQRRMSAAEQHLINALRILEGTEGPNSPYVAQAADMLGLLYTDGAKHKLAEQQFKRAWRIRKYALGVSVPTLASGLSLSAALEAQENYADAEVVLEEVHRAALGGSNTQPQGITAAIHLVSVLSKLHQMQKAQIYFDELRARCIKPAPAVAETCHSWGSRS